MERVARKPPPLIWAVSDGRAGNRAQALGLAEALMRAQKGAEVTEVVAPPSTLGRLLPPALWHALGARAAARSVAHEARPSGPWPDLAIGAGRRVAPFVAALRAHGVRTVQILDPQMPLAAFDAVVAPRHDELGQRVIETLGAIGRVTPAAVAEAAAALPREIRALPGPRLAVLLGGPGRMARWEADDPARIVAALETLAEAGWTLLVTASRRTPPDLLPRLAATLPARRHLLHDGTGANPYPGLLGMAEAVLVTADSVNMASEAAATGLPLHILGVGRPHMKAERFHADLAEAGIARPFHGPIARWTYPPLAEADRVAGLLVARLGLDPIPSLAPPS